MLYAALTRHKVKQALDNTACKPMFVSWRIVLKQSILSLIVPIHTLADTYALFFFFLAYSWPTLLQSVMATLLFIHYCIHCNPAEQHWISLGRHYSSPRTKLNSVHLDYSLI